MNREETIFKMVECANELQSYGDWLESLAVLQAASVLCRIHNEDMPDEGVRLKEKLNDNLKFSRYYEEDRDCLCLNIGSYIKYD